MKRKIEPGGVEEYVAGCPNEAQEALAKMRAAIRAVAPGAIETVSYFGIPGYSYEGYPYKGLFAWFSFKPTFVRLHVRPEALVRYKKETKGYLKTKAVISFPLKEPLPTVLVKKLVRASLVDMKSLA